MAIVLKEHGPRRRAPGQGWQIPLVTARTRTARRGSNRHRARRASSPASAATARSPSCSGFQGVHAPTPAASSTLGRGGSDTSAVALAAGLARPIAATSTPMSTASTPPIRAWCRRPGGMDRVSFEEMLEMASLGSKVLQVRSVEDRHDPAKCRPMCAPPSTTPTIPNPAPSSATRTTSWNSRSSPASRSRATKPRSRLRQASPTSPGIAAAIFGPLADANINVDMIIQVVSDDAQATTDITFTVPTADFERARTAMLESRHARRRSPINRDAGRAPTWSRFRRSASACARMHGVAALAFRALAEKGINIRAITTSEIKFSVLIDEAYLELAVRTLHTLYGLDKAAEEDAAA